MDEIIHRRYLLLGYENEKEKEVCRICGKSDINRFHSGTRYRRNGPPYYCSFKCNAIGERHKLLGTSIMFLIIAIACVIMLILDDVPHTASIIVSAFACSATLIFLINSIYGYIANNKRNEGELEQNYPEDESSYQLKDEWV